MKRKLWKQLLSLLLALALLCALLPQTATVARADDPVYSGTCGDSLTWTLDPDTGTLIIEGSGAMYDYYEYSNSAPWYSAHLLIKSIVMPVGLSYIGTYAFSHLPRLQSVTIPAGVAVIGDYAFYNCMYLSEVEFSEGLIAIGHCAFYSCPRITSIVLPSTLVSIGSVAFRNCRNLMSATLPDGLTEISSMAFCECQNLASINFPESLTRIGSGAFFYCRSLTSVDFSCNLRTIEAHAFYGCSKLSSVTFQEGLTAIEREAFYQCPISGSLRLPSTVEAIGINAFPSRSIKELILDNPNCLVGSSYAAIDTGEDLDYPIETDSHTKSGYFPPTDTETSIGYPSKTIVYGKHDPDLKNADEVFFTNYDDTCDYARYLENYAYYFGYTFYATNVFSDVTEGKWYEIPVAWAYGKGITSGTGNGKFSPNATCTREQIATFIWKAYDSPEAGGTENPFSDVNPEKYYAPAVLWAYYHEPQITGGMNAETFGVGKPCTRAQVVTFLYAAAGKPEPTTTENPFTDVKETDYFYKAVLWAVENGITSGVSPTTFGPKQTCTRAQVVTFLYKAVG